MLSKPSSLMSKPKWDWTQVDCNLKLQLNRKFTNWSLAPHIVLTSPSGQGPDPTVKLFVDTEKSLQFNEESQWNWHKSWNLPNISVRVQVKDSSTGQALLAPKKLFVQLFAVKAVPEPHEKQEATHLVDVGIRGNSKLEIEDGQAFFTAMKFSSTSYNHEGVKFYLLLVIFIQNNGPSDPPKIITSIVSPPIFVDSRKSARDNHEKKNQSFIEPFLVENLQKQYIKRQNKKRSESEIKIRNDYEGLFNYLTAPNIRHKVKHPLFIAIKFSQCSRLFFNTNQTGKEVSLSQLVNALQRKISKDHYSRNVIRSSSKPEQRMFVLQVMVTADEAKRKKICESIDPVECQSLGIVYGSEEMPSNFQNFAKLGNMAAVYKEEYSQLYITTRSIFDAQASEMDAEEGEQQESDDEKKQEREDGEQQDDDDERSESEKESSYPEYKIINGKPVIEHIPVLQRQEKKEENSVPMLPNIVNPTQETIIIPNTNNPTITNNDTFYKRSFSEPVVKKPEAQRPIQIPMPQVSISSKEVQQPILPSTLNSQQNTLVGYPMSQSIPNGYVGGEMNLEQLYLNNLMLSSAISNLKPSSYSNRQSVNVDTIRNIPNLPIQNLSGLTSMPTMKGVPSSIGGMTGTMPGMNALSNMTGIPNIPIQNMSNMYQTMIRPDQPQTNSYAMNDIYSMMMQNQVNNLSYNSPQQSIPQPSNKIGFSPTIPQPQPIQQISDPISMVPIPSQSNPNNSNSSHMNEQLMMMRQQVYKEVYLQIWQNQQRAAMAGQQMGMMQGMNGGNGTTGIPGMSGIQGMGVQGMGMQMNPYMYMPENMGYQDPKSENK